MSKPDIEEPVGRVARMEVEVTELRYQLELARTIASRRSRECERLEREGTVLRAERDGFKRQFEERNRLLHGILQSGSFRLMQTLRKMLGRD